MGEATPPTNKYTPDELKTMLATAVWLNEVFYWQCFTKSVPHGFIEFNGLMGEYLKLCQAALDKGQDFTQTNIHCGQSLEMLPHNIHYIAEKFTCIFGASFTPESLGQFFTAMEMHVGFEAKR